MNYGHALALAGACLAGISASALAFEREMSGIYYGFRSDQLSNKVRAEHYSFFPDGRALRGYPTEGFGRPVDWSYECRFAECGTWRREGGQVVFLSESAGSETRFTVDRAGVLRKPGSTQGYRAMHLLDNVRLNGTWGVFDPETPEPVVAIGFTPEGRFSETRLLPYLSWADLGSDTDRRQGRMPRSGEGQYRIRKGTLELRYDGGLVAHLLIVTPPAIAPGPTPVTLHVNGTALGLKR